ncbi:MAG: CoA transferase, partial [Pseudomonadota bacterium]
PCSDMLSRGKRAITLDLKSKEDRDTALGLIARSDAVIENFRPGVMERLGLGAETVCADNPNLIYLSMPGFASTDPDLADVPAWEAIIAARAGQFTDMGLNRRLMGINPSFSPLALASAYGAVFGAMAILFALFARPRCGGDRIEVPLASALFEGLAYNSQRVETYPARYKSPREVELERRIEAGEPLNLEFSELEEFLDPFYRTYRCADGRGFYVVSCSVKDHAYRALRVLGLEDLAQALPDFDGFLDCSDWPADWSMRNYPVGEADRARVAGAMKNAFARRSSTEWEEMFGAARAPATAQRSTAEWLADPHARASGLILEVDDPRHGRMRQMGNVAWLNGDAASCRKLPGPQADASRADILSLLDEPPRPDGDPSSGRGWLDGLKVVDLTNVIAGPTVGATLARFGAQVTHVQPVNPTVDPWNAVVFGLQAQRGKVSVLLDIKSKDGRDALNRLLKDADLLTFNGTEAQRAALALSDSDLSAINPNLIALQLDAFGGPNTGPKSDHLGYDDLAQAATGVMTRFGGGPDTPEEHAHFGTIDVLTGLCGCVALGAAMLQRQKTGRVATARTSLAAAGNLIQAQFMYDFANRPPFDEPSGRDARGAGPFYRSYEASDGWFFFAAPAEPFDALRRVPELSALDETETHAIEEAMERVFATQPISYWAAKLAHGSTAVMPLGSLLNTLEDTLVRESAGEPDIHGATFCALRHDRHPMGRWTDLAAPTAIRPDRAKITIPNPAPKYGAQTRDVLAQSGFSQTEIQSLLASRAAAESWSDNYLPE